MLFEEIIFCLIFIASVMFYWKDRHDKEWYDILFCIWLS